VILIGIQLFRGGSGGRNSRIPRKGEDDNGLSFYNSLESLKTAINPKPGTEWFSIDTGKLTLLEVISDTRSGKKGHFLLMPKD
jgi:hypothetical protein